MPGDWVRPFDEAEEEAMKGGRAVPDEVMDCWLCDQLGLRPAELDQMSVEQVWTMMGWERGKRIARNG